MTGPAPAVITGHLGAGFAPAVRGTIGPVAVNDEADGQVSSNGSGVGGYDPVRTRSPVDRLILTTLRAHGPSSRAEIASRAELSKSTVTEHLQSLLRRGLVVERDQQLSGHRGRPASVIDLANRRTVTVALVLSHSDRLAEGPVQCAVISPDRARSSFTVLPAGVRPLQRGLRELSAMIAERGFDSTGVGSAVLGVPLPLDLSHSQPVAAVAPGNRVIAGLAHVIGAQPQDAMTRAFGVPAQLANDADLAALGEAAAGAGVGETDLVFLKCLSGGGAGVLRGGQLLTGGRVSAGEFEHVQVEGGVPCVCGAPSCSGDGEPRALWARLHRWGARPGSMAELITATAAHDPRTVEALRRFGTALGLGLANIHLVFQPSLIVLEAGLGAAFEPLAEGLAQGVGLDVPPWARIPVRIAIARGTPSSEICGAVSVAGQMSE